MNINNTLFKNYRNISCKLRNKRKDINSKNYNVFSSSINKNYYKPNNNDLSYLFNKNRPNSKIIRKNNYNHNEYITINNNYYTIINNTTVNNINNVSNIDSVKNDNINIINNNYNKYIIASKNLDKEMSNCINIYNINKMSDKSPIKNIKPLINVKNSSNDNNKSFLTEKIKK